MTLPYGKLNRQKVERIKRVILEEPDRFFMEGFAVIHDMRFGVSLRKPMPPGWHKPPCGTTACLSGWSNILKNQDEGLPYTESLSDMTRAYRWLTDAADDEEDVDYEPMWDLFYVNEWPWVYRKLYEGAETSRTRARAAADLLDHLVAGVPS